MIHNRNSSKSVSPYSIRERFRETYLSSNHRANTSRFWSSTFDHISGTIWIFQDIWSTFPHSLYLHKTFRMCQVSWNTTPGCGHQWAHITVPCSSCMGFDNCKIFQGGTMSLEPDNKQTYPPGTCPWCDLGGWYDMNLIRMITKVKPGYHCCPSPQKGLSTSCTILWISWQYIPGSIFSDA
jgi:hypothetical protein